VTAVTSAAGKKSSWLHDTACRTCRMQLCVARKAGPGLSLFVVVELQQRLGVSVGGAMLSLSSIVWVDLAAAAALGRHSQQTCCQRMLVGVDTG
jgi:hypothetical protein